MAKRRSGSDDVMDVVMNLALGIVLLAGRLAIGSVVGLVRLIGWGRQLKKALPRDLHCPMGCPPQPADGYWRCSCGASHMGWVWDECPACGAVCRFIPCRHCGHAILNPLT